MYLLQGSPAWRDFSLRSFYNFWSAMADLRWQQKKRIDRLIIPKFLHVYKFSFNTTPVSDVHSDFPKWLAWTKDIKTCSMVLHKQKRKRQITAISHRTLRQIPRNTFFSSYLQKSRLESDSVQPHLCDTHKCPQQSGKSPAKDEK